MTYSQSEQKWGVEVSVYHQRGAQSVEMVSRYLQKGPTRSKGYPQRSNMNQNDTHGSLRWASDGPKGPMMARRVSDMATWRLQELPRWPWERSRWPQDVVVVVELVVFLSLVVIIVAICCYCYCWLYCYHRGFDGETCRGSAASATGVEIFIYIYIYIYIYVIVIM